MFQKAADSDIGAYLKTLIDQHYSSVRAFCRDYLHLSHYQGADLEDEVNRLSNRISQIKQGKKRIQLDDFPIFSALLGVTCEELLSAGRCHIPDPARMTVQQFAATDDPHVWDVFIKREDKLFLNTDEFGKTVLDYALDYNNYTLLKYLMDHNYIWFDSGNKQDYVRTFGAGTRIERKPGYLIDTLDAKLKESDELRRRMILLAIQNKDLPMLDRLRARELPTLYLGRFGAGTPQNVADYYDADLIEAVSAAGEDIIDYFSQEFEIPDGTIKSVVYTFPFLDKVLEHMLQTNHPCCEAVLRRCIAHNQKIYDSLQQALVLTIEDLTPLYGSASMSRHVLSTEEIETLSRKSMYFFYRDHLINFMSSTGKFSMNTNVISVDAVSDRSGIQSLIDRLNGLSHQIMTFVPDPKEG